MNEPILRQIGRRLGQSIVPGCVACAVSYGQTIEPANPAAKPSIFFDKQVTSEIRTEALPETERNLIAKMPANFHHFGVCVQHDSR
jgi:hypothetical protein